MEQHEHVFPNVLKAGDEVLPFNESLAKKREEREDHLERYRLYDHDSLKDAEARKGQMIHHSDLIRRVQKLNPQIYVQPVSYLPYNTDILVTNLAFRAPIRGVDTYLSAFGQGWIREFSIILVDEQDLPCEEVRGWRTVLLRLLKHGALTWEQVRKEFGDSEGMNSERWRRETWIYRREKWAEPLNTQRTEREINNA